MGNEDFKLPPGWHCRSLVDCTKGRNISYGIVQPGQHQDDGIGIIRVNNIQNGKISVADVLKVSHDVESKFSKTRLEGGEVLLTLVGSTGLSAITTKDLHGWNVARAVAVIKPSDEISAEWIHICLQSPYTKYFLDSRANTTVQKTLNLKDVKEIPLPIPPIQERMNLEKFYFDLENKINLNFEINQTLEQISQTLFKSWFVDYDPVIDNALDAGNPIPEALQSRAKLRQKVRNSANFKPLPAAIRALFPAEFDETELGWVPGGWKKGSLPDIAFINSTSWGTKNQPDYVNYVDLSNAKDGIISSIEKIQFEDAPSRARRILKKDDLIFGLVRPANRSFAYVHIDGLTGSTGFAVIRAKNTIYKNFIYYFVTYDKNVEELARIADGGAYPAIKPDDICSLPLIIPPEELVQSFDESTSNFRDLMNNSLVQNDCLTVLRDTLLPKLISGELSLEDLPDLIKQTEAA
ncbi:restriction endonuclease subunit S [Enterobacter cloacae]|uniref:restriction endonuclease subunit S n=1 Tax=Enterobacter cloacae TaxID=550 RepID=UPI00338E08D2